MSDSTVKMQIGIIEEAGRVLGVAILDAPRARLLGRIVRYSYDSGRGPENRGAALLRSMKHGDNPSGMLVFDVDGEA
ncbi:MAG: hypothetical protein Q8R92_13025 [Deltaproteobacteria bacterium]|nr:hypothetical protein [Deltaproteobacteria bacterium]